MSTTLRQLSETHNARAIVILAVILAFFGVTVQAQGAGCTNPFFPVYKGASWTYTAPIEVITLEETRTVTEVSTNAFSIVREERTQSRSRRHSEHWHCNALGLLERLDNGSTRAEVASYDLYADNGGGRIEQFVSGTDLPNAPLHVGMSWESDKQLDYGPVGGKGTRYTNYTSYRVTARERVTVPAGNFEAFRVDYQGKGDSTSPLSRADKADTNIFTYEASVEGSKWYAEGVGLVKEVRRRADTNVRQTPFIIELSSFTTE